MRGRHWLTLLGALGSALAVAGAPPAITPRAAPTGFSTIEQRYVYAPPDKGELEIPLLPGGAAPNEVAIEEPIMCSPDARAKVEIEYDKALNRVRVKADFHRALPYRLSLTRPADVSTPYNQFPVSVHDGKWQIWFVGDLMTKKSTFYYDPLTLQLIGNEHELPGGPPPGAIAVQAQVMHMLMSPLFEGDPQGNGHFEYELRYDQLLDPIGSAGVLVGFLPYNLCKPDEYGVYYTNTPLPPSEAMTFDDVLKSIWSGQGIAIATSLEPDPRPAYLGARDNPMIGWGGAYPAKVPAGYTVDPVGGFFALRTSCGTHVQSGWPKGFYNLCGAP